MKKLTVTIRMEMEVPDTWSVEKTSDGIDILKIADGRYLDMSAEPLIADLGLIKSVGFNDVPQASHWSP